MARTNLTPAEVVDYAESTSCASAAMPPGRFVTRAVLGGAFLGLGGLLATVVAGGALELGESNPGLQKFVFGAVFPLGFIAVVLTGADLFTSNCATFLVAWYRRSLGVAAVLRTWTVSYLGNFAGALAAAALLGIATGLYVAEADATVFLHEVVAGKLGHSVVETLARGVGANLLVCIAAWQAYSAGDTLGKMAGIWFPVMGFVALGMEHSIANMFFVPAAILSGLDATWGEFLIGNLLPATIGNIIGGGVFIGLAYAWVYTSGRRPPATSSPAATRADRR